MLESEISPENKLFDFSEEYSKNEKKSYFFTLKVLAGISIFISIGQIIVAFLLNSKYQWAPPFIFGLFSCCLLLLNCLTVYWASSEQNQLEDFIDKKGISDEILGMIIFISLLISLCLLILGVVVLVIWKQQAFYWYIAQNGDTDLEQYVQEYNLINNILLAIISANIILHGFMGFCAYILIGSEKTFRIAVYILCLIATILACWLLYIGKIVVELRTELIISKEINFVTVYILIILAIFTLFGTLLLLLFNSQKWKLGYLIIGSFFLISCSICFGASGHIFRNARGIAGKYSSNCKPYLFEIHKDVMESYGCSEKYLSESISQTPYLNCRDEDHVIAWEDVPFKDKMVCLNRNCCMVVSKNYQI